MSAFTAAQQRRRCNDNPYAEAQFKTLKYRPEFPGRFGSIEDARAFCQGFFRWSGCVGDPASTVVQWWRPRSGYRAPQARGGGGGRG